MANLMEDLASGSSSVLRLQQNVAAAPYVQETAALAAQENRLKVQQEQATLEKTKLDNLVTESGFKAAEESKEQIKKIVSSPDFQQADDVKRLEMLSAGQFKSGDVTGGLKTLQGAEILNGKKTADEIKALDHQAQVIGNAYGVISTIPDDQVDQMVARLPKENQDAIRAQVGDAWNAMSGKQKKEALSNLMMNAKGQLAQRKWEADLRRQQEIDKSREKVAEITAISKIMAKVLGGKGGSGGGSGAKDELSALRLFQTQHQKDQAAYKAERKILDEAVDNAQKKVDEGRLFGMFGASDTTIAKRDAAIEARKQFELDQVERDFNTANLLPKGPTRDRIIQELKRRAATLGKGETPEPKVDDSEEKTPEKKPSATSNKVDLALKSAVESAGQKYEPDKYDYRIAPDGSVQRKAK